MKESLLERSPFVSPSTESITDDSVVDSMNIGIFLEKIRETVPNERIEVEVFQNYKGVSVHFINRFSKLL